MTSKTISTSGVDQPLGWLVEFDEMVKPDTWEWVRLVVYEKPEGHYADCATPITIQRDIDELTGMPNVYNFLGNKGSGAMNKF